MTEKNRILENKEWEVSSAQLRRTHGYAEPKEQKELFRRAHEAEELASEILRLARSTLLINLRFLESALVRVVSENETATSEMATDGQFLYYNSVHVCRQFRKAKEIPVRDYLHIVLHCLFRHLFVGKKVKSDLWDLCCDIAVESLITDLGIKALYCERQERQKWLVEKLRAELPRLTAERLYHYFLNQEEIPPGEWQRIREAFYADDHKIWHNRPELSGENGKGDQRDSYAPEDGENVDPNTAYSGEDEMEPQTEETGEERSADGGAENDAGSPGEGEKGTGDPNKEKEDKDKSAMAPEDIERMWKEISERIQVDLETFSGTWGDGAGDMRQALAEINRETYDYAQLLKRFAVLGENMEINDDEFDYIFYTYGMALYQNMPLVEPLEYKEVKRVREFVIALDTSESVSGELVQKFVTKTWNILKQSENFFTKVNVHIIQCGARVEEDTRITSDREFDAYIESMVLKGFGGTDFRPTFTYVDSLIKQHEFQNFKGLIYFTDGYGTFPAMPPDYEAAFVFVDQKREIPDVPPWAIKIMLTEAQIRLF
ncbi:VWA-like domain-containing protein [Anaerovorax odorimutans]|uniref:VWA-like domain-containing protein n=1 Tax=Anaerovorax odorimutans TaxID=109327 RepID=A0ABT1RPD2_9FIRM|nr:VWA-like domain-containing protein [Anaerovorax odorimutans]MCQ4637047.1 VWA-like domain-containing protein [Anaerovorax odorimutans]